MKNHNRYYFMMVFQRLRWNFSVIHRQIYRFLAVAGERPRRQHPQVAAAGTPAGRRYWLQKGGASGTSAYWIFNCVCSFCNSNNLARSSSKRKGKNNFHSVSHRKESASIYTITQRIHFFCGCIIHYKHSKYIDLKLGSCAFRLVMSNAWIEFTSSYGELFQSTQVFGCQQRLVAYHYVTRSLSLSLTSQVPNFGGQQGTGLDWWTHCSPSGKSLLVHVVQLSANSNSFIAFALHLASTLTDMSWILAVKSKNIGHFFCC